MAQVLSKISYLWLMGWVGFNLCDDRGRIFGGGIGASRMGWFRAVSMSVLSRCRSGG